MELTGVKLTGLLIRTDLSREALTAPKGLALGAGFELEPLFQNQQHAETMGVSPAPQWYVAKPKGNTEGANPWDLAHQAIQPLALAPGDVFIEPDLLQRYITALPGQETSTPAKPQAVAGKFEDQDSRFPKGPGFAWFLQDQFSQLRSARATATGAMGPEVIIAHLDTGYDPKHHTVPERLKADFGWNFVENQRNAFDPQVGGTLRNPGHGTGTLSILAGNKVPQLSDYLGGAPQAGIIPVRIATSVVLFETSALAKALDYILRPKNDQGATLPPVDVVTLSMGGVASQAWADAVNRAYEAGVCIVAAAGNNFSAGVAHVPTRFIVYPARFRRVIAACGIMANYSAYDDLPIGCMQGNFGPPSAMATAMAAYTPNMPWAEIGAPDIVDMDGQGTSSATPQVAAAAALWLTLHANQLQKYTARWQRVEAVRHALFSTGEVMSPGREKLGNGSLRALAAMQVPAADEQSLTFTPPDTAFLSLFRVLTGMGISAMEGGRERMFSLEAAQLIQQWPREFDKRIEDILPDPDLPTEQISTKQARQLLELLANHPLASSAFKARCQAAYSATGTGTSLPAPPAPAPAVPAPGGAGAAAAAAPVREVTARPITTVPAVKYPEPVYRCLRGYSIDPSLQTRLDTAPISTVTFKLPWERLDPGPVGEYLEVIDYDPASKCFYAPVDLEDRKLLAQEGLPPAEGAPQFHQQMAYAVSSLTIKHFERALGRVALWRPQPNPANEDDDSRYVRRLRIYPHALREANAYYSPQKIALLFGYYPASADDPGEHVPGGLVFTCLSHDVVAHETTHALLDGMHRSYTLPTNPDMAAFHEAFADIVALFQHFTYPELVQHQIAEIRGDLRQHESMLAQLAGEFGRTTGKRGALRDAIGRFSPQTNRWEPRLPDPKEYESTTEPHERGAILVAAVFDAFLSIYERRTRDLLRLATNGSGILPLGAMHPDLVGRLSEEVAKAASHVLEMCIRALDYCPPIDLTFGEYLRALITADRDLVPDDDLHYRVAFIEAFRRRGLYPRDLKTLSEESLAWRGPDQDDRPISGALMMGIERLRDYANRHLYAKTREHIFYLARDMRVDLHAWLQQHFSSNPDGLDDGTYFGLKFDRTLNSSDFKFEVRAARLANRVGPDGNTLPQFVIELLQKKSAKPANVAPFDFFGGATIIADLRSCTIRYCIRKDIESSTRLEREAAFHAAAGEYSLRDTYFSRDTAEPFAFMHRR